MLLEFSIGNFLSFKEKTTLSLAATSIKKHSDTHISAGTNEIFNISGPVFDVLADDGTLMEDELDASLHPLLTVAEILLTSLIDERKISIAPLKELCGLRWNIKKLFESKAFFHYRVLFLINLSCCSPQRIIS